MLASSLSLFQRPCGWPGVTSLSSVTDVSVPLPRPCQQQCWGGTSPHPIPSICLARIQKQWWEGSSCPRLPILSHRLHHPFSMSRPAPHPPITSTIPASRPHSSSYLSTLFTQVPYLPLNRMVSFTPPASLIPNTPAPAPSLLPSILGQHPPYGTPLALRSKLARGLRLNCHPPCAVPSRRRRYRNQENPHLLYMHDVLI